MLDASDHPHHSDVLRSGGEAMQGEAMTTSRRLCLYLVMESDANVAQECGAQQRSWGPTALALTPRAASSFVNEDHSRTQG